MIKDEREEPANLLQMLLVLPRTNKLYLLKRPNPIAARYHCHYCRVLGKPGDQVKRSSGELLWPLDYSQPGGRLVCLDLIIRSFIIRGELLEPAALLLLELLEPGDSRQVQG